MTNQDFPDTVTIEVTPEDIAAGVPVTSRYCPIAFAVKRVFPKAFSVSVSPIDITIGRGGLVGRPTDVMAHYRLPMSASRFIRAFDAGGQVEPITFEATRAPGEERHWISVR